jgi:hypothetical protein
MLAIAPWSALVVRGQSYSQNEARLKEMTPDQKEDLRRKKQRFDELSTDEQKRLRDLHQAIAGDPNAQELSDTVTRYNRWLANLDSTERSTLLDIKDPAQRIARIKELMQQQEKRRFDQYFANLPEEDRKTIFSWLGEFVAAHADAIRERLPPPVRQRIDDAPDEEAKRREIFAHWQRWRREFNLPFPSADDYSALFKRFSAETQKTIDSSVANELSKEPEDQRTPERQHALQQQRITELWRTALYSRFFPQIGVDELLKYYAAMKPDDQRRKQLDGKEGEELRRELQRMYNWEHGFGRGGGPPGTPGGGRGFGPGGGWQGPKGGPRGDGRGKPGDRFDDKDRGGKPPPPPSERPPPADGKPADAK